MPTSKTARRRKSAQITPPTDHRDLIVRRLELLAGIELQHGHHAAAEQLAWRAAEVREAAR